MTIMTVNNTDLYSAYEYQMPSYLLLHSYTFLLVTESTFTPSRSSSGRTDPEFKESDD